jgi:cellulose synthase/poly-beta-1,6-N-acetylglucosamine synthase-like glycosyltransferase
MTPAKIVFWASTALLVYTYFLYPLILLTLAAAQRVWRALRSRQEAGFQPAGPLPTVSLVVAAHNEEAVIAQKLRNCRDLDYPADRLEILLGCDGCTDRTAELARASAFPNTRVVDFPERAGKAAVLNRLLPRARGEIVVFSDATAMLERDALRKLAAPFDDPAVGCVGGEMRLRAANGVVEGESAYWRYERFLKLLESRLNLLVGASGCLYAIRRRLFRPIPRQGIIDDFLIAMRVREAGYRIVYAAGAVAQEEAAGIRQDFHRHVRIGAGNFHALRHTWRLLLPTSGATAFAYWSHKVLRWLAPFALIAALASALAAGEESLYAAAAACGVAFVALAAAGFRQERRNASSKWLRLPYYFLAMNLALLLGFVKFLTGRQTLIWNRPEHRGSAS